MSANVTAGEQEGDATAYNVYNTITKCTADCRMNDLNYLYIIIKLRRCVATRVAYMDKRTDGRGSGGRQKWRALRGRTDGRAGTGNPAAEWRDGLWFIICKYCIHHVVLYTTNLK